MKSKNGGCLPLPGGMVHCQMRLDLTRTFFHVYRQVLKIFIDKHC